MFIIPETNVVLRLMFLDQVAFKNERFELTIGDDPIEVRNLSDHPPRFRRVIRALLEIGPDAISQVDGFADIEDGAILVLVKITARLRWEVLQLFGQGQRVVDIIHPRLFYLVRPTWMWTDDDNAVSLRQ